MSGKIISFPNELLWSVIGLLLTIGGTFLDVSITNVPWQWNQEGIKSYPLGVTYQVGAVLFTACMGGPSGGVLSQIAYVVLGLLSPFSVFGQGRGIDYLKQPSFGYLLGFIFAAGICGYLAFKRKPKIEYLAFCSLCGLFTIHVCGITYLVMNYLINGGKIMLIFQSIMQYSISVLPGQLIIVCVVTVLSFLLRHLLFY
jgi:biotin transport system substrate-specific component